METVGRKIPTEAGRGILRLDVLQRKLQLSFKLRDKKTYFVMNTRFEAVFLCTSLALRFGDFSQVKLASHKKVHDRDSLLMREVEVTVHDVNDFFNT